jgi:hypothetical protein
MRECPECQGCGYVVAVVGDYFSDLLGNYLPLEREVHCPTCGGYGFVEEVAEMFGEEPEAA